MRYESFDKDKFHVIAVVSNPMRFDKRYNLFEKFVKHMQAAGVNLWVTECQTGDRPFVCTSAHNPQHLQLRSWDIVWIKENLMNVTVQRLPANWETVAFIDADIEFMNIGKERDTPDAWVTETLHQLQIYKVVQMWENAIDMGPNGETIALHESFMSKYVKGGYQFPEKWTKKDFGNYTSREYHPGFCWAFRREAFDELGGWPDLNILGAGDRILALSLVGKAEHSLHPDATDAYKKWVLDYQDRSLHLVKKDVGYVKGTICHMWHGNKKSRQYWDRWKILVDNKYDPFLDVKRDWQGLIKLDDYQKPGLRDGIRKYFAQRNEDSIDL
jgi:hypothetical protein